MTLTRRQMMKGVTAVGAITLGSTLIGFLQVEFFGRNLRREDRDSNPVGPHR